MKLIRRKQPDPALQLRPLSQRGEIENKWPREAHLTRPEAVPQRFQLVVWELTR